MENEMIVMESSMRNKLHLIREQLIKDYGDKKVLLSQLRISGKMENGESNVPLEATARHNKAGNPTDLLIGEGDAFVAVGWLLKSLKVTDGKHAASLAHSYARSDIFDGAAVSGETELQNLYGFHNYGKLSYEISGDTIIPEVPTELLSEVPPVANAAAGNTANRQSEQFEEYKAITDPLVLSGTTFNTFNVKVGGGTKTIAGDGTASPAEQNYGVLCAIGFLIKDGATAVDKRIAAQQGSRNICQP